MKRVHKPMHQQVNLAWTLRYRSAIDQRFLPAGVNILIPDDIILTKIAAGLHFDQDHGNFSGVFHPVNSPKRDIDGLIFTDELSR